MHILLFPSNKIRLKTYIRRSKINKFYKKRPHKVAIMIQNTFSKFKKTKTQTQKDSLKVQK